jgi:membrane-bound serine protease (ClpP class)
LVFLGIAFVLFVLDIKAPTHGALTAAGVASLIIGTLVLFNSPGTPEFQRVSVPLVVGVSAATGFVFFAVMTFALRAQRAPVRMGQESLVGRIGVVRTALKPTGQIQLGGELWTAELIDRNLSIHAGEKVEVIKVDGLRLYVKPVIQS